MIIGTILGMQGNGTTFRIKLDLNKDVIGWLDECRAIMLGIGDKVKLREDKHITIIIRKL